MGTYTMLWAYGATVLLTAILVLMNVRSGVREFRLHRYVPRLIAQLVGVVLVGSMLITVSYFVIDRTFDAALSMQEEALHRH
jgi:hypothetical protein